MSTLLLLTHDRALAAYWAQISVGLAPVAAGTSAALVTLPPRSVALCDLALPGLPPLSDPAWLGWSRTHTLVAASTVPDASEHVAALAAGCRGYAHAYAPLADWHRVLETVLNGGFWIGQEVMQQLLGGLQRTLPHTSATPGWQARLSEREQEVARLAARGEPSKLIARQLGITERTVKAHLSAIFAKLGVADRLQLALLVNGAG
ncbi:response regulator transcription factor [Chitiniphilus purpureus]|uniref:Response regulator transcription factor n=1 Tax=Chitiniphilus purpureus TaxID=2981137 RepID=A0ABY6DJ25_9NEIS|nr:response regulator transcription factor [Chitiniphilus sp. CD1]UXY14238.1 response regulator transcription factor [Chitiniphilus sp. CD1]